jgi:hypothetical protein
MKPGRPPKHGHAKTGFRTSEYVAWVSMISRCVNPSHKSFGLYGGRGIRVCARWLDSFSNFLADMGVKPDPSCSVDRIDPEGDYEPRNCRWATPKQQARNRRNTTFLTSEGTTKSLMDWAEELGVSATAIRERLRRGWSDEEALSTPFKPRLTKGTVLAICKEYDLGGVTITDLATRHATNPSTVQAILSGRQWGDVTGRTYTPVVGRKKPVLLKRGKALITKIRRMIDRGMSQRAVARELGTSHTTVARILEEN